MLRTSEDPPAAVSLLLADTLRRSPLDGASSWSARIGDVVRGAVRGALQVGSDLAAAGKGIVAGVSRAALHARQPYRETLRLAASELVQEARDLGGDPAAAARGAVEGAIEMAKEARLDVADSARAAADAILESLKAATPEEERSVRTALQSTLNGIRVWWKRGRSGPKPGSFPRGSRN